MFWSMTGFSATSPVETILDKDNFTLEELLDEDEIIQECKALNGRLINFLREREQVERLVRYIVEEPPEDDAEKKRTFKFPFIACEIFTCEIDMILKTLAEDEGLLSLLFSFLEPKHVHSTLLAGYFSKVVICMLMRKTVPIMQYVKEHQEILKQLVDLIGITSIMEVLIRLIGLDEHVYASCMESMRWVEDTDVLEMIVDKFSFSDSPDVHANAAETLCAITRFAPPGLAAKISSPNFIDRLFQHAFEDSRPKSVLVNSLSVCISLLDPKRHTAGMFYLYNHQLTFGTKLTPNPETVVVMLESLGNLLRLLDVSPGEDVLVTTYGKLQPPLGKHRLKIVEFISVLMTIGSEATEQELIRLGVLHRIMALFFEYPYNSYLHHLVENIILSCLESKNSQLVDHVLRECDLVGKILEAEKKSSLPADPGKPTVAAEGKRPHRIGNIGHLTRISNKLVQLANSNGEIQAHLQENIEWIDWHTNVLSQRNQLENIYSWACGRPTSLHDRMRDSDDDDYQDRDYDVAALANNLSQAFRYGVFSNDEADEVHGSRERGDEDVYFDDESAEVVISSLRLGDDQERGSHLTNSDWSAFEDERAANEQSTSLPASSTPNNELTSGSGSGGDDAVITFEDKDLEDTATSTVTEAKSDPIVENQSEQQHQVEGSATDKPPTWVEWRETTDSGDLPNENESVEVLGESQKHDDKDKPCGSCPDVPEHKCTEELPQPTDEKQAGDRDSSSDLTGSGDAKKSQETEGSLELTR